MPRKNRIRRKITAKSIEIKNNLEETEETLSAIRQGMVDALLVSRSNGTQVVTLNDADFPYRMMVESMNEGAVTLIPDGTIFYCNSRFGEMVGIETEHLIGTPFRNLIMPEGWKEFETLFTKAGEEGTRGEFCLKKTQGDCVPVQLSLYQLGTEAVTGISILVTDMTEHKQAQEALQKSENLFRLIATNSPDVIFAQDRDLRYKWIVNPASPLSAEQVIGKTDWDLLPSEQAQHLAEFKKKILETGVSLREEILLSPSGSQRWFGAIYQPLYDQNQQIVGIVCYARDITERVHAEEKIRSLASQLMMAEQEERQRISQILHDDLQQRLFAIRAQLSVLEGLDQKERVVPGIYSHLNEIETSLTEAITLTRKLSIDFSPVVLQGKKFTDVMTWLSSRMLEQHGLQVELEAREDFDHLDNHMRMLLFQSVSELLFNIVKHAGILKAKITLDQDDRCSRLTISDNGNGFDVTAVMTDSKTAHGLLVLQDRLGIMGCKMEITSAPGKGTRVVIEVPRGTP